MAWIVQFTGVTDVVAFASSFEHMKAAHKNVCADGSSCRPHGIATRFMQSSEDPTTVLISVHYKDQTQQATVAACPVRERLFFGPDGFSQHWTTREPIGFFTDFWSGDENH